VVAALLALAVLLVDFGSLDALSPRTEAPRHHLARGFQNLSPEYAYSLRTRFLRLVQQGVVRRPERGSALASVPNDGAALRANGMAPTLTWIGHSTFLVQLDGVNILTDPHWGERASPVDFAGPRRLLPPGMRFEDLPPIHAVVISHDHYDHLDEDTVRQIARVHRARFFVPLGLQPWLADTGVADVVELDWWQTASFRGLTFVCTPAQHSSGRGLNDQNLRLWSSWAVLGRQRRLFFAGDTGYWSGLAAIGERLGPFDVAAVPVGGYYAWGARHPNHVNPEEAVQLFEDVRGRVMVPMHWGTFDMNREPFQEPPGRVLAEAARRGLAERVALPVPGQTLHW
jgi:N-acyl-phosphatidylethanolamine-hydrolysing phospholipase D